MNIRKKCSLLLALFTFFVFPFPSVAESASSMFTLDDFSIPTSADAVPITLNNEDLLIRESGIYSLSGSIEDGCITVDADEDSIIYLLLNGVSVTNSSGSALHIDNAQKVILTLEDGTVNTFTQEDNQPDAKKNNAVIYSACDLTINGTGLLAAVGNYRDGINCKGKLRIVSGELSVSAQEDAVTGKDAVCIGGGNLTVISENGDAISSNNTEDSSLGYIAVSGGILSLKTGGGSMSVEFQEENLTDFATESTSSEADETQSRKGLKAESMILFTAGSLTADTVDDAVHSNGSILIQGGVMELSSGEDGIQADNELTVSDGIIHVNRSYEGLEAPSIHLDGGEIRVTSWDDGINAAGGALSETAETPQMEGMPPAGPINFDSADAPLPPEWTDGSVPADASAGFPMPPESTSGSPVGSAETAFPRRMNSGEFHQGRMGGFGMFSKSTGTMSISGGTITVISEGDGIDVNGDFLMSGGTVYVRGSQNAQNAAIDFDGTFTLSGGTLIALGFSGMAMSPTSTSVPGCMLSVSDGGITISGSDGTSLFSFAPEGVYENAVIYSDLFTEGETCQITSGDSSQEVIMSLEIDSNMFGRRHSGRMPFDSSVMNNPGISSSEADTLTLPESITPSEEKALEETER